MAKNYLEEAWSLNHDPPADVWSWLDCAIAEAAKTEYDQLTEGMSPSDQGKFVEQALAALGNLQKGIPPNYNDKGVALFYLTWYQPRQIFLAYSALRHVLREQKPPSRIIDYGCGVSAVQIALSILTVQWLHSVSIRQRPGYNTSAVHGIDPSEPMRRIGEVLWRKFEKEVKSRLPLLRSSKPPETFDSGLLDTVKSMTDSCESHASYEIYANSHATRHASVPDDCWLTAMHAVYDSNRQDMETVFSRIREEQEPTLELVTFSRDRRSGDKQRFFGTLGFEEVKLPSMPDLETNSLESTTRWRRHLWKNLKNEMQNRQSHQYLRQSVEWNPRVVNNTVMIRENKR